MRANTVADFAARLDQSGDCWLWTGSLLKSGYGSFSVRRRSWRAHRYAYEAYVGPIGDKCVCHRCDNPRCCNPAHLFLGTPADNAQDRAQKGRGGQEKRVGELNVRAKLTEADVRLILRSEASGGTLSRELGVSRSLVGMVRRREIWSHVNV